MTRGRAGAMLGPDGAKIDYAAALLDVRATTRRDWPRLPEDVKKLFTAYAAGLNHYADKHPGEVRLSGLFPMTGEDVVAGFVLRSPFSRSEERRGGKECVSTCRSWWSPSH